MTEWFKIYTVEGGDAARIASMPDEPHSHEYEELLVGVEGYLDHFIDFKSERIEAPYISFVARGKVHRVIPGTVEGKCLIWVLRFKNELIPEVAFQLYTNFHDSANIGLFANDRFRRLVALCEILHGEMVQDPPDFSVIRPLLTSLLTLIEVERKNVQTPGAVNPKTQNITFKNFLKILEENFRRSLGVEYYAEKLFMSSRNLNIICQNVMQQSASEIIETRKLIEAKNLLVSTDKPVSEIGFELGYNEKSYFTTVFKKKAGQTPSDFRKEMRKLL